MKGTSSKAPAATQKTGAAKGKDVATVEEQNTALAVYDYGDDASAGFEEMGRDDFAMPFLYILQSNSPIVEQGIEEAARPGVLMNSISSELYPADKAKNHDGLAIIVCHRDHVFVEWKPRDAGGGFVAQHAVDSDVVARAKASSAKFGEFKTPEGNELQETFYLYALIVKADGGWDHIVIPFNSTKIKVYKQLMTRLNTLQVPTANGGRAKPPIFAHRLRLRTERQENSKGAFFNFSIGFDGDNAAAARLDPRSEIYAEAKSFWELCRQGIAKPNYETANREQAGTVDAEIPF